MGYKAYSDGYLMSLTKAQIIELLRVAEHNFFATEEALNNSAKAGMEIAEKFEKAKRLLKVAVDDLNFESQCRNCKHQETGLDNVCRGCRGDRWEWRYADEAEKLLNDEK